MLPIGDSVKMAPNAHLVSMIPFTHKRNTTGLLEYGAPTPSDGNLTRRKGSCLFTSAK